MSGSHSEPLPSPLEALYWTQYGTWYPVFRKHAPKSTVIDIDSVQPELLEWFEAETFLLPQASGPSTSSLLNNGSSSSLSSSSQDPNSEDDEDQDANQDAPFKLESLDQAIRAIVEKYDGGPVFPKLNWSAPLDAGFMLPGNNLQCLHPEDVYLLLKSSEFIGRDLEQISHVQINTSKVDGDETASASDELDIATRMPTRSDNAHADPGVEDEAQVKYRIRPQLVLKKWFQLSRSYEFRCFVRANSLIAISQRDVTFYDHLQSCHLQSHIRASIWQFWHHVLEAARTRKDWCLSDYVFDVYLTKDLDRVWLIDINAWLPRTDPLLWSFDELEQVHLRQVGCRNNATKWNQDHVMKSLVRLRITPTSTARLNESDRTHSEEQEQEQEQQPEEQADEWGESHVELRVLTDRRMQSSGGTGATYSSNMVPKDLVEFAKSSASTPNGGTRSGQATSVDQIVTQWNKQTEAEEQ